MPRGEGVRDAFNQRRRLRVSGERAGSWRKRQLNVLIQNVDWREPQSLNAGKGGNHVWKVQTSGEFKHVPVPPMINVEKGH
ncbi:MAG: hypothetical protein OXD29_09275 [Roseovarius sp.]|nr:hypothetical protein [Roseovarius sp.]MCY4208123.1 hypothetical protein [Roseovarius sp.]MCY4292143.1 hypothetical protein [Roseovarius sp.]